MPWFVQFAPFIPIVALIPPSLAAMWIANRWLTSRRTNTEIHEELAMLREEVGELRQANADLLERLDLTDRMISQVRDGQRDLPRGSG
jgi:hypothetical protein